MPWVTQINLLQLLCYRKFQFYTDAFFADCAKLNIKTPDVVEPATNCIDNFIEMIEVRVTPQRGQGFDKIAERIYNFSEVNAVYLISGGYDLMVMLEGHTLQEVAMFVSDKLSPLDSVLSTATHFVLKKYKEHGTILVSQSPRERMLISP